MSSRPRQDASHAEPQGRTVAPPALQLDERTLRRIALDLLGRPPLDEERRRWVGAGRHALLEEWLASEEAWRHWRDEELYFFLLIDNFQPAEERVLELPGRLAAARADVREAVHRIVLSPSFERRNPGADTFVTVVLEQLAGMSVQRNARVLEIGKRMYDGQPGVLLGRRGASQADVVDIVVHSREFARTFLARQHRRLLRSEPPSSDLAAWTSAFQRDPRTFPGLVRDWLLSPAYEARLASEELLPNRLFVRSLFVDLCGRLPEPAEGEALREALDGLADSLPLRNVVARMLVGSGRVSLPRREQLQEPAPWVRSLFSRLLAREPQPEELETFLRALRDPACGPELVVEALVSDPEYHRW